MSEEEIREEYNEYLLECLASDNTPMTLAKYKLKNTPVNIFAGLKLETPVVKETKKRPAPGESKSAKAKLIYIECVLAGTSRKETLRRFREEALLTTAGATTYHANFKKLVEEGKLLLNQPPTFKEAIVTAKPIIEEVEDEDEDEDIPSFDLFG